MERSLSYVIITPYTVAKNRIGGVLARLLLRLDLELVGAQMIAPDVALADEYAALLEQQQGKGNSKGARLLADYVRRNLGPSGGRRHRSLLLLFSGENPCRKLSDVCGPMFPQDQSIDSITGETIRDTYADLITDPNDPETVKYFEPALLTPRKQEIADTNLKLFARWLPGKNPIIENIRYPDPSRIERTLVILKPDNWKVASSKPGIIIDMFSKTGVRIVGVKVHHMSPQEAITFYSPLRGSLIEKFSGPMGDKARDFLEKEFQAALSDRSAASLRECFGVQYAEDQFQQVIEFMTGLRADRCTEEELMLPGKVKSMVLVYEGEDAQKKIRAVLGPTDPMQAPAGTIRRDFGSNIMVNTAHASNSLDNARREMDILRISENSCAEIIGQYLEGTGQK